MNKEQIDIQGLDMCTVSETMLNIKKKIEMLDKKHQELLKVVNKDKQNSTNPEDTVNLTLHVQNTEEQCNSTGEGGGKQSNSAGGGGQSNIAGGGQQSNSARGGEQWSRGQWNNAGVGGQWNSAGGGGQWNRGQWNSAVGGGQWNSAGGGGQWNRGQ